jgi:hypothetical protein
LIPGTSDPLRIHFSAHTLRKDWGGLVKCVLANIARPAPSITYGYANWRT